MTSGGIATRSTRYPCKTSWASSLMSFKQFPPRQKPGSFTVGDALESLSKASPGGQ